MRLEYRILDFYKVCFIGLWFSLGGIEWCLIGYIIGFLLSPPKIKKKKENKKK